MNSLKSPIITLLWSIFFLISWHTLAISLQSPNFPDLLQIANAWQFHWYEGSLYADLIATLRRVASSFTLAMILGVIIGIVIGRHKKVNRVGEPLLLFFLNLPALVTIILCYIWIGLVESAAILAVIINKVPLVVVTLREGVRVIDHKLLELAQVYHISRWRTFWLLYLPQLYPYILAAARNGLALIWKIVLVVELLGRSDGIGFGIYNHFQFFDIPGILAYALTFMGFMFAVDVLIFKQLERRIQRGRGD